MRKPFEGDFPVTQNFADPRFASSYHQFGLYAHNGKDFATPVWTPILSPHKGTVIEATDDPTGYGNYVKVQSDDYGSVLGHLSKISVAKGQQVEEGQLIGYSGNSGNSTGPHLHWGFYCTRTRNRDNGFNGYIDQTDWLDIKWPILEITDQTKYDFGGDIDIQELGAIRSQINDLKRENMELKKNPSVVSYSVSPQKPPETVNYSIKELFTMLFQKIVK